ncbi:DUF1622 domain-containing protein [Sphingorhabdus lacus]|uniref:DUF1622 domain-containing protein n=1 Tax=Sphingorhabdus lacus TaxID=392610 RepID=A0A6I6L7H3_9SPHN|nr:DUF1622 domain-containing protein [Sphingorhabdus lacus]QGY80241.1 DUF1622 domain-containing protein [Sphingorhabdus lacus]
MTIIEPANAALDTLVRFAVLLLELAGTMTILAGAVAAIFLFVSRVRACGIQAAYQPVRAVLGRSILLGLEFLVAGDILKSLVINPSLDDLLVLAGLILVRTFLSVSLGVEINGHWPWQETAMAGRTQPVVRPNYRAKNDPPRGQDEG